MRKSLAIAAVLITAAATNLWAIGEARITGKVLDREGNPIANAEIRVESLGSRPFDQKYKSGKDGRYSIFLLDGTQQYQFTVSKEGFAPYKEAIKLKLNPEKNEQDFTLAKEGEVVVPFGTPAVVDPSVETFNAGVALANEGKNAEAIAKMEEALAAKPGMAAALQGLTQLNHRVKDWQKVITYGEQFLEISPDEPQIFVMLADAYKESGNKAKAAEYAAKAPKNPTALFNQAAQLINSGKMAEAAPLLEQAIAADPEFAQAYYELGMLYAGMSKNAEARRNLQKYLELEPSGNNAATAKEMLAYVK